MMKDLEEIRQALDRLDDRVRNSFVSLLLLKIKQLKDRSPSPEAPVSELIELFDGFMRSREQRGFWDPAPAGTHVHIAFGDSFAGSLKLALKELGRADTQKMIVLRDNYAVGPLRGLDSSEGRAARCEWLRDRMSGAVDADQDDFEEGYQELLRNIEKIPPQARIVLWSGRSASEQAGLRHAVHLMQGKSNAFSIVDACSMCEALYNRPDRFIHYLHLGEVPAKKLREVLSRIGEERRLSEADIARLAEEWRRIADKSEALRIRRAEAVAEVPANFYDDYLLEQLDKLAPYADGGFIRSARVIGEAIGNCDQAVGDAYFEYRLRELIYAGALEIKGVPAGMRYYSVRRKRGAS